MDSRVSPQFVTNVTDERALPRSNVLTFAMEAGLIIAIGFAIAIATTNGFRDAANAAVKLQRHLERV